MKVINGRFKKVQSLGTAAATAHVCPHSLLRRTTNQPTHTRQGKLSCSHCIVFRSREPTLPNSGEPNIVGSTLREAFFFQLLYSVWHDRLSRARPECWPGAQAAPSPRQSSKPGTMQSMAYEQSSVFFVFFWGGVLPQSLQLLLPAFRGASCA